MSRPIKFRAWDKEENRYWYLDEQGTEKGEAFSRWIKYPERYVIEQFTGLLDKNGKEIYEGDIVKNPNGIIGEVKWVTLRFEVIYHKPQLMKTNWQLFAAPNFEVIGNIYENHELLETKS